MSSAQKSISSDVGLLAAAAVMPGTLQKSMIDRDATDQGIATGLSMALAFSIAVLMQDGIEAVSNQFADDDNPNQTRQIGIIGSATAVAAGIAVQTLLAQKDKEPIERSIGRTLGYWLFMAGTAGLALRGLGLAFNSDATNERNAKQQLQSSLFIFPLGVLMALLFDLIKHRRVVSIRDNPIVSSPALVQQ